MVDSEHTLRSDSATSAEEEEHEGGKMGQHEAVHQCNEGTTFTFRHDLAERAMVWWKRMDSVAIGWTMIRLPVAGAGVCAKGRHGRLGRWRI